MASVCFQGKPFKQQVYAPTSNAEEAEVEWFCEDLQDLLELLLLLLHHFSRVRLCVTRETAAHQAPLSLGFSGKNTGLGCHFLLQCMKVKSESEVAQSCPTLSDPMDCSRPGSSAHGVPFPSPLLELTPIKDVFFIIGDWNAKVGSQETPEERGKFGLGIRNEAGQRLIEFCQENALVITNNLFQQHKTRLYTWTSSDGQQ